MKIAIFPGSFDPITLGHQDIIERASKLFDKLYVVILENAEKRPTFPLGQRLEFLQHSTNALGNVECGYFRGLTIDYAKKHGACAIIRGVRSVKDYEYEMDIASINYHIDASIETLLLYAAPQYSYISSSMIKEMVNYHQDIHRFVSDEVAQAFLNIKSE